MLASTTIARFLAITVVITEALLSVGIFVQRTRRATILVALAFHGVIEFAVRPDVMSLVIASLLIACWRDDRIDRPRARSDRTAVASVPAAAAPETPS